MIILQEFRNHWISGRQETKPKFPFWNKKAIVFTAVTVSAYEDQLSTGFSKIYEVHSTINVVILHYFLELIACWSLSIGTSTLHFDALKLEVEQNIL